MPLAKPPKWRPLTDWFQRLEPGCPRMGVDADAFSRAMIDRDEHRRRALAGDRRRQIGSPHRVHRLGDDGTVMVPRPTRRADPSRRQQIILAHQPKHPPQRGPDCGMSQPCPDLAMTFAMERAGGQHGTDRRRQRVVGHRARWSAPPRWRCVGPRRRRVAINPGSGEPPDPADCRHAIRLAVDRRNSPAHGLSLRRPKGRLASRMAIFSSSRSRSINAAPSLAFSRSPSRSSPVAGFVVSAASPAAQRHHASRSVSRLSYRATAKREGAAHPVTL